MYIWNGLILLWLSIGSSLSYCCGRLQLAWPGDSGDHVQTKREHEISRDAHVSMRHCLAISVFYNGGRMLMIWEANENIFYDA